MAGVPKNQKQPPVIIQGGKPGSSAASSSEDPQSLTLPTTEGLSRRQQQYADATLMPGGRRARGAYPGQVGGRDHSPYPASLRSDSSGTRTVMQGTALSRPSSSGSADTVKTSYGPGERVPDLGTGASLSSNDKVKHWSYEPHEGSPEIGPEESHSLGDPTWAPGEKKRQKQRAEGGDHSPLLEPLAPGSTGEGSPELRSVSPRPAEDLEDPHEVLESIRVLHSDDEDEDGNRLGPKKEPKGLFGRLASAASSTSWSGKRHSFGNTADSGLEGGTSSSSWTSKLPSLPTLPTAVGSTKVLTRSLSDLTGTTTKSLGSVAKAMDPTAALAAGWKNFGSGVAKTVPKIRDPLFKLVDTQVNAAIDAMFGYKDPMAGFDLPPPEKMTYDDAAKLVAHLKEFYLHNSGSPAIDLEDIKKEIKKEVFPVVKDSIVKASTKYAADKLRGALGMSSRPALVRNASSASLPAIDDEDDGDSIAPDDSASTTSTSSKNSSNRSGRSKRSERSSGSADSETMTDVAKQVAVDVTTQFVQTAVKRVLDRSKVLNPEKHKPPSGVEIARNVYDKVKEIYEPIVAAKSEQTRERIAQIDLNYDIDRGATGGGILMVPGPIEDKLWERIELAHHNPPLRHSLDWRRSDELNKRITEFKNPDTLRPATAAAFDDLVFDKLKDPNCTMFALTLYSEQPGGGKNMHVAKLGETLDRPVITIEPHEFFHLNIWDASPGSFMARKLARHGQTDVILHIPEYSLPYNPDDPRAAEETENAKRFKNQTEPTAKYMDGKEEVPHHFIIVFTSQFSTDHIKAAFERAPSAELRAETRQRNFKAKETVARLLQGIEDETVQDRTMVMAKARLEALGHIGDIMDCGLRMQERMTQNIFEYCRTSVENRDEPSELSHDMKMVNLAIRLSAAQAPSVQERLREVRTGIEQGKTIQQQSQESPELFLPRGDNPQIFVNLSHSEPAQRSEAASHRHSGV